MSEVERAVATVLAEHRWFPTKRQTCRCGWSVAVTVEERMDAHTVHVAATLAPLLSAERARALDEAADIESNCDAEALRRNAMHQRLLAQAWDEGWYVRCHTLVATNPYSGREASQVSQSIGPGGAADVGRADRERGEAVESETCKAGVSDAETLAAEPGQSVVEPADRVKHPGTRTSPPDPCGPVEVDGHTPANPACDYAPGGDTDG
jgi:hypothetical protein